MSEPDTFTTEQASDPATPARLLADIAALRPDLRPAVARNPSAYPGLLDWLAGLGEPSVDAALRARPAAAVDPAPATGGPPGATPVTAVPPTAPVWDDGTWRGQNATSAGGGPYRPAPYAPHQDAQHRDAQPHYAQPHDAPHQDARPQHAPPYDAHAPYGGAPYGRQPYASPGAAGGPPRSGSRKALWIVLGVLAVVVLLAVGGVLVARGLVDSVVDALPSGEYGSDPTLDALWDRCADEDWAACDELFFDSPVGSEYEAFGETCGRRTDGELLCTEELGGAGQG